MLLFIVFIWTSCGGIESLVGPVEGLEALIHSGLDAGRVVLARIHTLNHVTDGPLKVGLQSFDSSFDSHVISGVAL